MRCFVLFLLSLVVRLFVRWHYAEVTGDRRGYDASVAKLSDELRSSWVDRRHNRGCSVLRVVLLAYGGWRYALLDRTSLVFFSCCGHLEGPDLLGNAIISVFAADLDFVVIVSNVSVVCCNHSERLERLLPLSGDVRALDLLPEFVKSIKSAGHPSSRRRGACGGLAGTVRVCRCLSC